MCQKDHFETVVVGAGVMGCWTALFLQESGRRTLLLDAWGVGNPRASSAGESRIIRSGYGPQALYSEWSWQALAEWKRRERLWGSTIFVPGGALWMGRADDPHLAASLRALPQIGIPFEEIDPRGLEKRFEAFSGRGVGRAFFEPEAGILLARKACRLVAGAFVEAGGRLLLGQVQAPEEGSRPGLSCLRLVSGERVEADCYIFAAGPWLARLFPELLARHLSITRQEVFFLGPPAGSGPYLAPAMPAFIEFGEECRYGLPGVEGKGVKVASDRSGPPCDPSHQERLPDLRELERLRGYLATRMPGLAEAPVVETRVCQYARTSDLDLILDRHPDWPNVWLVGGGSGHGFKLGPTAGRLTARAVIDGEDLPGAVCLARFGPHGV